MEPAVLKREGLDVGFISVDATPLKGTHIGRASQNSPGIYKLEVSPHFENSTIARADMEMFTETIRSAAEVVDFLILSAHWGRSPNSDICTHQRELGRIAVDHGADLVFGHHPHTPQPPEVYEGAPILYGLGGFAFDLYLPGFSQYGCVAECGIDSEGADISELALRPVGFGDEFGTQGFGWNTVVEAHILTAEDPEGEAALQELMTLCEREGTDYHRDGDRILLRQAEGTAS
jgi:poly-gamma-glutamate synthesis protein (capsule biosynthesis protein)